MKVKARRLAVNRVHSSRLRGGKGSSADSEKGIKKPLPHQVSGRGKAAGCCFASITPAMSTGADVLSRSSVPVSGVGVGTFPLHRSAPTVARVSTGLIPPPFWMSYLETSFHFAVKRKVYGGVPNDGKFLLALAMKDGESARKGERVWCFERTQHSHTPKHNHSHTQH